MVGQKRDPKLIAAIFIILIGGGLFAVISFDLIPTGWQTVDNIDQITVNDVTYGLGTTVSHDNLLTGYVYDKLAVIKPYEPEWDSTIWSDGKYYMGTTKTQIQIGGPVGVRWSTSVMDWVPTDDQVVYQFYDKVVGDTIFTYQHLVYEVDVKMSTDGSTAKYNGGWWGDTAGLPRVAFTWTTESGTETYPADPDHTANVEARIGFTVQQWSINVGDTLTDGENDFQVVSEFMGIMSASIISVVSGSSASIDDNDFVGKANPVNQAGTQLSMFNTEGSSAVNYYNQLNTRDESILGEITNVPQTVIVPVAGELEPATAVVWNYVLGLPTGIYSAGVVDTFIDYRIRFDVITSLGVEIISGAQPTVVTNITRYEPPPNPPPTNIFDWLGQAVGDFFDAIGDFFSNPFNMILIAVIVVIFAIVLLKVLGKAKPSVSVRAG